jgi:hypothetical protein
MSRAANTRSAAEAPAEFDPGHPRRPPETKGER